MTVEIALPEEEVIFKDAVRKHIGFQLGIAGPRLDAAMKEHYVEGHATAMHVLSQGDILDRDDIHRYIVSRPTISPLSLTGRGTKGFWAVHYKTRHVVFLKDCWAEHKLPLVLEGQTLERLAARGVRNIPLVECHGLVPDELPMSRTKLDGE